ncbi:MAG TPA: sulfatase [Halanaerobiales bacterium]|nr:sulfatase [Halanaerobiales bacterium]
MKPNILYIHSHDTGRYIEPYGYPVETPNLQNLAEEGALFREAFSTAPTCSPSRASLLTGQYPHNNGQLGLVNRGFELDDPSRHIVNTLKKEGYNSALIGMQHIRKDPKTIGYDKILDVDSNYAKDVTPTALDFIGNSIEAPFFLSVGFEETHRPFPEITDKKEIKYSRPPADIPDTYRTRKDMAAFKESAKQLDHGIGKILLKLKEKDLYKNTIIIYTTDHGIAFPKMKCTLSDLGIGVALIIKGPKIFEEGKVIDSLVSHIDIYPTLCEILDINKPNWLQGKSLIPLLNSNKEEIREKIFGEVNYHTAYEPMRTVRTQRWKYIKHFRNRTKPFLSNTDESLTKDVFMEYNWHNSFVPQEELYDTLLDPTESNNLAYESSHKDILEKMREELDHWMEKTDDPLKRGEVPRPKEAVVNKDDDQKADQVWNYTDKKEGFH